jgi:hypothetical protein
METARGLTSRRRKLKGSAPAFWAARAVRGPRAAAKQSSQIFQFLIIL